MATAKITDQILNSLCCLFYALTGPFQFLEKPRTAMLPTKQSTTSFFQTYPDTSEPVNNFWTLTVKNYCSSFLSLNVSAGGLIHAASGKAGGNG
ncbi:MAG: hypothetical protein SWQ30_23275, partial [Thermodesulfobacteriota bacterium]|nr:hypothetical protein [Thermodesulfobacteriota bacterium]